MGISCALSAHGGQKKTSDQIPRTGITDGFEPPYGCWKLNPGILLQEQQCS